MNLKLGRIQITRGTPVCQPGKCIVCGNCGGPHEEFVDFGFEIDFYGVVYFCRNCIREVSETIGFLPVDRFEKLEQRLQQQIEINTLVAEENRELKNALDSLNRVGFVFSSTDDNQLALDEVVDTIEPESVRNSESVTDTEPARETGLIEQDDEPRFTGLSNDESHDSIFKL